MFVVILIGKFGMVTFRLINIAYDNNTTTAMFTILLYYY